MRNILLVAGLLTSTVFGLSQPASAALLPVLTTDQAVTYAKDGINQIVAPQGMKVVDEKLWTKNAFRELFEAVWVNPSPKDGTVQLIFTLKGHQAEAIAEEEMSRVGSKMVGAAPSWSNQRGSQFRENTKSPGKSKPSTSRSWRVCDSRKARSFRYLK